jgi:hypothetical protein
MFSDINNNARMTDGVKDPRFMDWFERHPGKLCY